MYLILSGISGVLLAGGTTKAVIVHRGVKTRGEGHSSILPALIAVAVGLAGLIFFLPRLL